MINDETRRKLRELSFPEFVNGLDIQQGDPEIVSLTFDERMQRLVDYVFQEKYNSKIQRLIKGAKFRLPQADYRQIYYENRGLDKHLLQELFTGSYLHCHQSIIFQGPTGSGKTFLACCLGKEACLSQIKTRYIRLPDLLLEYEDACIAHTQKKVIAKYGRIPLLIIDEWLVSDLSESDIFFLFELMERRSDTSSTIFCTQYKKNDWIVRLGESIQADAIVDRFAHSAYWIETGTMNMREYMAKNHL